MKKFIIIVFILLLLVGGGIGGMTFMGMGPFATPADEEVEEEIPEIPSVYVDIDPLSIPIFKGDRVVATLMIVIKVETQGDDNAKLITKVLPRIGDAFLRDMYVQLPIMLQKQGRFNIPDISRRLEKIAAKFVGPDVITGVLIQSLTDTPN